MDHLISITSFLGQYGLVFAALVIAVGTTWVVWLTLGHFHREFRHPPHLTRTEEHQEFERQMRHVSRDNEQAGCMLGGFLTLAGFGLFYFVKGRLEGLPHAAQRIIGGGVFVVTVAGLLFSLKVKGLRYYALLEMAFALASSIATLYKMQDQIQLADAAVLGTAIYLLIRGLDNFKKDVDDRKQKAEEAAKAATAATLPEP